MYRHVKHEFRHNHVSLRVVSKSNKQTKVLEIYKGANKWAWP